MTLRTRPVLIAAGFFAACGLASATIWNPHPPPALPVVAPPAVVTPPVRNPVPLPKPPRAPGPRPAPFAYKKLPPLAARYVCLVIRRRDDTSGTALLRENQGLLAMQGPLLFVHAAPSGSDICLPTAPAALAQALEKAYPDFDFTVEHSGSAPVTAGVWHFDDRHVSAGGIRVHYAERGQVLSALRLPTGEIGVQTQTSYFEEFADNFGDTGRGPGGSRGARAIDRWKSRELADIGPPYPEREMTFLHACLQRQTLLLPGIRRSGCLHLWAVCLVPASRSGR